MNEAVPAKPEEMKPMLHLCEKDLPDMEDWEVGKKYTLVLETEMVGQNINKDMDGGEKMHAEFKVLSVTAKGTPKEDDEDEKTPEVAQAVHRKFSKEEEE